MGSAGAHYGCVSASPPVTLLNTRFTTTRCAHAHSVGTHTCYARYYRHTAACLPPFLPPPRLTYLPCPWLPFARPTGSPHRRISLRACTATYAATPFRCGRTWTPPATVTHRAGPTIRRSLVPGIAASYTVRTGSYHAFCSSARCANRIAVVAAHAYAPLHTHTHYARARTVILL